MTARSLRCYVKKEELVIQEELVIEMKVMKLVKSMDTVCLRGWEAS